MSSNAKYMLSFLYVCVISCKSDEPLLLNGDWRYFPLKVGSQWIYSVEETTISQTTCGDVGQTVSTYDLQLIISDSFPNTNKSFTYVVQRSKRLNNDQPWVSVGTWTSEIAGNSANNNENNIAFVKLMFPLSENLSWNGNLLNSEVQLNKLNEDIYKISSLGKPYTNPAGITFDKTVTVLQSEEQTNLLYRDTRSEVYAFDIGLVYKESYLLNYFSNSQLPCYGQNKIQQGYILKQSLKEYRK